MSQGSGRKALLVLIVEIISDFIAVLRAEARLARAEIALATRKAQIGILLLVVAVVVVLVAIIILALSLVAFLISLGLRADVAAGCVGLGLFALAAILVWRGSLALKSANFMPRRAADGLARDLDLMKRRQEDDQSK